MGSGDNTGYPLGTLLQRTRKRAELTQEELAERAGVSVNTISNLEAGRGHLPRQATLDLLVDALARALAFAPPEQADLPAAFREAVRADRAQRQLGVASGPVAPRVAPITPPLPTGTLTFLICAPAPTATYHSDEEASSLPYLALLQQVAPPRGGRLVYPPDGPDGTVWVFPRPDEAVVAACALRQALRERGGPWAHAAHDAVGTGVTACLALHTGWAEPGEGDYAGPSRLRAVRLARLGQAGQILLTQATRDLVWRTLPEGIRLEGIGRHSLSAVERPQPLYHLLPAGTPGGSPPLRVLSAPPTNLPVQLTSLVGRDRERAAVGALMQPAPLVTLTGAGGCGKTRLALAVAADLLETYPDGVWLVELAVLADPALVPQAVARALGLVEQPGQPLPATLADHLRSRRLLLVLDNCEQLLTACAELAAALLRNCPHLQLLATSRERLGIGGETNYRVPPLAVPEPDQQPSVAALAEYEGVLLFVERARAGRPDFVLTERNAAVVARICRRLDGMPLAIELAAARVGSLPLDVIAAQLVQSLEMLIVGQQDALPRQRTLRATLDWSWNLLGEPERVLLRRLATFAGGWALEAAETVCGGPGLEGWPLPGLLGGLVRQSLVGLQESGGAGRYGLLETVRQYGLERLAEAGEPAVIRERHLAWCVALAEEAESGIKGPEQGIWLARLDAEYDNLRAALGWARGSGAAAEGLRLAGALGPFWDIRGYLGEGRDWLEGALADGAGVPAAVRAKALNGAGVLAYQQGDHGRAAALLEEALAVRRELGDQRGIAVALSNLGLVEYGWGAYGRAEAVQGEALELFRALGDRRGTAFTLHSLGLVAQRRGEYGRAEVLLEEALALRRVLDDRRGIAVALNGLADGVLWQGAYDRAESLQEEALALFRDLGDRHGIAYALSSLGLAAGRRGEYGRAEALLEEALTLFRDLGAKEGIAGALDGLGEVGYARGEFRRAAALYAESVRLGGAGGAGDLLADGLEGLGLAAAALGRPGLAARLDGAAAALRAAVGAPMAPAHRAEHERAMEAVRAALGEGAFASAWAEGGALPVDAAIALALEGTDEVLRGQ